MTEHHEKAKLGSTKSDLAVAGARAGLGLIPWLGPTLAELVSQFIPNQRIERIESYLRLLDKKLSTLSEQEQRDRTLTADAAELIEEGGFQAARAITDTRREQLASVVAFGLKGDEAERIEAKRILSLLREIDDDQIVFLCSHLRRYYQDEAFMKANDKLLYRGMAHTGLTQDEMDQSAIHELAKQQLVTLGLVRPTYHSAIYGRDTPEFDEKTGTLKSSGQEITPLGRLVLRRLGLATENDY